MKIDYQTLHTPKDFFVQTIIDIAVQPMIFEFFNESFLPFLAGHTPEMNAFRSQILMNSR